MAPRVFNDDLIPGIVIYVSDMPAAQGGQWNDVFMYDDRDKRRPERDPGAAAAGSTSTRRPRRSRSTCRRASSTPSTALDPTGYDWLTFESRNFPLPFEQFFPILPLAKGDREMSLGELQAMTRKLRAERRYPEIGRYQVEFHKKFAIAAACVVFGLLGLGLSLGSKKEARSAAFGLSLAVIFIYYVLIRLGEQAGDTGMLAPWVAMWSANIVLGIVALVLLVLNHREAAFDPLDPTHYRALVPQHAPAAGRRPVPVRKPGAPAAAWWCCGSPASSCPCRGSSTATSRAPTWQVRAGGGRLLVAVRARPLHGPVRRHPGQQGQGHGGPALLRLLQPADRAPDDAGGGAGVRARHLRRAQPAQRDHGHEGGGHQRLPRHPARAGPGPAGGGGDVRGLGVRAAADEPREGARLQRHQGPAPDLGQPARAAVGAGQRQPALPLRLHAERSRRSRSTACPSSTSTRRAGTCTTGSTRRARPGTAWATTSSAAGAAPSAKRPLPASSRRRARARSSRRATSSRRSRRRTRCASRELREHIATLEALGLDVVALQVKLHGKVAFPFVCLVMTLLGIPFAFVVARRGALYGIGLSIFIAIVYWATLHIFDALGANAVLPPMLAAWAPNLAFGAAGLYLMLTLETYSPLVRSPPLSRSADTPRMQSLPDVVGRRPLDLRVRTTSGERPRQRLIVKRSLDSFGGGSRVAAARSRLSSRKEPRGRQIVVCRRVVGRRGAVDEWRTGARDRGAGACGAARPGPQAMSLGPNEPRPRGARRMTAAANSSSVVARSKRARARLGTVRPQDHARPARLRDSSDEAGRPRRGLGLRWSVTGRPERGRARRSRMASPQYRYRSVLYGPSTGTPM